MNYITKEFLIPLESPSSGDMYQKVKAENRIKSYCRARLGQDYSIMSGVTAVEAQLCPECARVRDCFITQQFISADSKERIIGATCMECDCDFFAYQEEEDAAPPQK